MPSCSDIKCCMKESDVLYLCSGTCGRLFHPKCAGHNANIFETVSRAPGLYWYCVECRKTSLSVLAYNMNRVGEDFAKLSKSFDNISAQFLSTKETFNKILEFPDSDPITISSSNSNSYDSIKVYQPSNTVASDNYVPDLNLHKDLYKNVTIRKKPKPINTTNNISSNNNGGDINNYPINTIPPVINQSNPDHSIAPNPSMPVLTNHPLTPGITNANISRSSEIPVLLAVPPSKSIFVSRLLISSTHTEVLNYIKNKLIALNIHSDHDLIKCKRITSSGSTVASFKISVPVVIFDLLISPTLWPCNTFVKEFEERPRANVVLAKTPNAVPKN